MKNRIRAFRLHRGWSMERLATEIGSTIGTINRLETGETDTIHEAIPRLARVFGCSITDLVELGSEASGEPDVEPFIPDSDHPFASIKLKPHQQLWRVKSPVLKNLGIELDDVIMTNSSPQAMMDLATGRAVLLELRLGGREPATNAVGALQGFAEARASESILKIRQFVEPDLFVTNTPELNAYPLDRKRDDIVPKALIENRLTAVGRRRR